MSRIAIIGGHGHIALLLARILSDEGHVVTSIFRNPDHLAEVSATGAAPVVADVERLDEHGLVAVIADHDVLVWSAGAGGGSPERTYAVDRDAAIRSMDAAASAGVERYLMVSYSGADVDHGVDPEDSFYAYAESKAAADEYLRESLLSWTIIAPSTLTHAAATGRIDVTRARGEVSRENVARVIAASIHRAGTVGRTIPFTDGPVPIDEALDTLN